MPITLTTHEQIAVWHSPSPRANLDLWVLPGFGESHLCMRAAFHQCLVEHARVYVFDLPGCGATPPRAEGMTIAQCAVLWRDLIEHFSGNRPVALLGHSLSGIIATQTARLLPRAPAMVISVEGNLTAHDTYFSGLAFEHDDAETFYTAFTADIRRRSEHHPVYHQYLASLLFADANTLWQLGRSINQYPHPGKDLMELNCPKIHYWDAATTNAPSQEFIRQHAIPHREFSGLGHWPMVTNPEAFYHALDVDLLKLAMS